MVSSGVEMAVVAIIWISSIALVFNFSIASHLNEVASHIVSPIPLVVLFCGLALFLDFLTKRHMYSFIFVKTASNESYASNHALINISEIKRTEIDDKLFRVTIILSNKRSISLRTSTHESLELLLVFLNSNRVPVTHVNKTFFDDFRKQSKLWSVVWSVMFSVIVVAIVRVHLANNTSAQQQPLVELAIKLIVALLASIILSSYATARLLRS